MSPTGRRVAHHVHGRHLQGGWRQARTGSALRPWGPCRRWRLGQRGWLPAPVAQGWNCAQGMGGPSLDPGTHKLPHCSPDFLGLAAAPPAPAPGPRRHSPSRADLGLPGAAGSAAGHAAGKGHSRSARGQTRPAPPHLRAAAAGRRPGRAWGGPRPAAYTSPGRNSGDKEPP